MAQKTVIPDQYHRAWWNVGQGYKGWGPNFGYSATLPIYEPNNLNDRCYAAFLLQPDPAPVSVSACSLTVTCTLKEVSIAPADIKCTLINGDDPTNLNAAISSKTVTVSETGKRTSITFSFSGLGLSNVSNLSFFVKGETLSTSAELTAEWSISYTYTLPTLSVTPTPSVPATPYYIGTNAKLDFENRLGNQLSVTFKYNNIAVRDPLTVNTDSVSVPILKSWFTAAGVSGSSMRVDVAVTDDMGRTASTYFNATQPQGSTATPTAPKNTTADGSAIINFAWSISNDWGTQTKAELQWSTDNINWTDLATVNGSAQTWAAPAVKFPGGTIYWHVRVTNSYGVLGAWSSAVSFTVRYDAVSQAVPVNSPTSGNIAAASAITFAVTLAASGPVYSPFTVSAATFYWRAGTSGDFTGVSMTASGPGATVTITGGTFPSGTVQWYAAATDNTGRTTQTPVYTLTAAVSVVDMTPRSPINTVESANGPIVFEIGFISLDGETPTSGQWSYSYDNVEWHTYTTTLANNTGADYLRLTIPANFFSAGTVYWKARAQNSDGVWGDWSEVVSFKVFGAPIVEGVTADSKPFCTISWQVDGQVAYELEIDGKSYGPYFGEGIRSYTTKEPLADGVHSFRVRAQSRYGLWSEWTSGTAEIVNVPGPSFYAAATEVEGKARAIIAMLNARIAPIITRQPQDYRRSSGLAYFDVSFKTWEEFYPATHGISVNWQYRTSASAAWQAYSGQTLAYAALPAASEEANGYQYRAKLSNNVGEIYSDPATFVYGDPTGYVSDLREGEWKADTGYFIIYRNGKLIGKTYDNFFIDRLSIGAATYEVIQVIKGGYYTRGTIYNGMDTVTITPDAPMIAALSGGDFFPLCLSDDAEAESKITRSVKTVKTWYSGARFPAVEVGEEETLSASLSSFWLDYDSENADKLEALLGKEVVLKLPHNRLIVGVLDGLPGVDASYRRGYTVTLEQMEWEDFVDVT